MRSRVFDADSHVMETEDWLPSFAESSVRDRLRSLGLENAGAKAKELMDRLPSVWAEQRDQEVGPEVIAGPKGWLAPGALDSAVRSKVLDALGIGAQLVFPTFSLSHFSASKDLDVLYGGTDALNRAMCAFCEPDPRLNAVGFLPLLDPERAVGSLDRALELGVAAVWIPSDAPGDISPAHVDFEALWARLAEARVPFVLHVGGGKLLPRAYHNNGRPRPTDWLGGGENMRAKDFPVVHHSPERFLACLVLDGVLERHPSLRGAAIELGASWVPAFMRNLDHAYKNFSKFEPLLGELAMKPSDYVRRQLKFTPFPFEDTRWLIEQEGPELFMFSTDYPHPEGGRHPFEIFAGALDGFGETAEEQFFWANGAELLGLS